MTTHRNVLLAGTRLAYLACLTLVLLAACQKEREVTRPQASVAWLSTFDEAKLEAQKSGDRILVSFEAYWCPWSRLLGESLYVDSAVIESLSVFKCVVVDADRDSALCAEYDVRLYPTILVTDPYGGELARMVGFHAPEDFLRRISFSKHRDVLLSEMFRKEEQSAADPRFLMDFGDLLRDLGTYSTALLRYEKAASLDRDNRLGICEEATYAMAECTMLAGEYREAARSFRSFADANPSSEKREEALILGALCCEQVKDRKLASDALDAYLRDFRSGTFAEFAAKELVKLRGRTTGR
jgi:tetratricopeptide (TPR) repeat protein